MTLVELSALVRKLVKIFFGLIILYIIFLVSKPILLQAYYQVFPPKDLPNPIYGQLEPLVFVEKENTSSKPVYSLNTKDGRLPRGMPNKMIVYKYKEIPFSYSASKDAQDHASSLGYTQDELITDLKGDTYRWRDKETSAVLEINTTTEEMLITTPLVGKGSAFEQGGWSSNTIRSRAQEILRNIGRFDDVLYTSGSQNVIYGSLFGSKIIETTTINRAHFARVDFFRKVNDVPILGPDPKRGLINVVLSNPAMDYKQNALEIPFMEYRQWELLPTVGQTPATYPLITVAAAWDAVAKQGQGVIVNLTPKGESIFSEIGPQKADQILVQDIYLAYYDTPERQTYLQPIYVFEGTYNTGSKAGGSVTIYYPAIQGQYIKTDTAPLNQ